MPTNHRPVLVSLAPASRFKTIKIIKICLTAAWVTKWCDQTTTSATAIRSRGDYKNPVSSILQHTYSNMTSLAYCCPYCAYCSIIIRIWYFNKYVILECFTLVIFLNILEVFKNNSSTFYCFRCDANTFTFSGKIYFSQSHHHSMK